MENITRSFWLPISPGPNLVFPLRMESKGSLGTSVQFSVLASPSLPHLILSQLLSSSLPSLSSQPLAMLPQGNAYCPGLMIALYTMFFDVWGYLSFFLAWLKLGKLIKLFQSEADISLVPLQTIVFLVGAIFCLFFFSLSREEFL